MGQVRPAAEAVYHLPGPFRYQSRPPLGQGQGHGVDGKIPPGQIVFNTSEEACQVNQVAARLLGPRPIRRLGGFHHHPADVAVRTESDVGAVQPVGQRSPQLQQFFPYYRDGDVQVGRQGTPIAAVAGPERVAQVAADQKSRFLSSGEAVSKELGNFSKNVWSVLIGEGGLHRILSGAGSPR